jgi:hypothetical protein
VPTEDLGALHEVVVPAAVPLTPQTAGWWLILAALLVSLAAVARWGLLRWRADAYRRAALVELEALRSPLLSKDPAAFSALAALLKRVALQVLPREEVASLSGEAWLRLLDGTWESGSGGLTASARVLTEAPYLPAAALEAIPAGELEATLARVQAWVERHRA